MSERLVTWKFGACALALCVCCLFGAAHACLFAVRLGACLGFGD
jgi:hypothetical protein